MGQNQKARFPYWFAINQDTPYCRITDDLLKQESYSRLSASAIRIYQAAMTYQQTSEHWKALNAYIKTFHNDAQAEFEPRYQFFMFPRSVAATFPNMESNLYRGLKELEKKGFIRCVVRNVSNKQPNIYAFIDDWKPQELRQAVIDSRIPK